jgi:hypothetical protein
MLVGRQLADNIFKIPNLLCAKVMVLSGSGFDIKQNNPGDDQCSPHNLGDGK